MNYKKLLVSSLSISLISSFVFAMTMETDNLMKYNGDVRQRGFFNTDYMDPALIREDEDVKVIVEEMKTKLDDKKLDEGDKNKILKKINNYKNLKKNEIFYKQQQQSLGSAIAGLVLGNGASFMTPEKLRCQEELRSEMQEAKIYSSAADKISKKFELELNELLQASQDAIHNKLESLEPTVEPTMVILDPNSAMPLNPNAMKNNKSDKKLFFVGGGITIAVVVSSAAIYLLYEKYKQRKLEQSQKLESDNSERN